MTSAIGITKGPAIVVQGIRHNALDKVIGHCLMHGVPSAGGCVLLSGRVNLEMVTKAARSVGITLCGFVRGDRLTAFCHPQRLRA